MRRRSLEEEEEDCEETPFLDTHVESNPFEQQNNNINELSPQTSVAAPSERSSQTIVLKKGPVFIIIPLRAQAEPTTNTQSVWETF